MSIHYVSTSLASLPNIKKHNHLHLHHKTSSQNSLKFILETFQCNISQEQAWALIYQSTKTLNELITEYERDEKISEFSIGKLTSFSNIIIDYNGNVMASTWNTGTEINVIKSDDRKSLNESINTLMASLATIIYSALEWNWKHEHDMFKYDHNDDDDDDELDLDESLEILMLSMVRGSENKDLVDEGYIDAMEENCIHSVLNKCQIHFNELSSSEKKNNSILEMLSTNTTKLGPDYYYRTVCKMMLDEALKLNKLVNQFCDNQNYTTELNRIYSMQNYPSLVDTENLKIWAQTWIKVMSELRFGVRLRSIPLDGDSNQVKEIKEPRMNELIKQIKTKRENLRKTSNDVYPISQQQKHHSLPFISQDIIVECLKNLKSASRRKLLPRVETESCLHERLMNEIRNHDLVLRPTLTIVKPCIKELYLKEKQWFQDYRSLHDLKNSQKKFILTNKRKCNSGNSTIVKRSNSINFNDDYFQDKINESSGQLRSPLFMRSEFSLNWKKKKYFQECISNDFYQNSTPKSNSSFDVLSIENYNDSMDQQIGCSFESLLTNDNHQSLQESYLRRSFMKKKVQKDLNLQKHHGDSFTSFSNANSFKEQKFNETNDLMTIKSIFRKSFRSSLNLIWSRFFGPKDEFKFQEE